MKTPETPNSAGVSRRGVLKAGAVTTGTLLVGGVGIAAAYDFPSTNADNRANGFPHVNEVGQDNCEVTLEFVNDTNSLAFFEYRIDGVTPDSATTPHPVVSGDVIYPGVSVDGRGEPNPVVVTETFEAFETVEVRLALGGERDWDFDWTTFEVECNPETKADCKNGGWEAYGFRNQGQCIRYVNTGKDSR
jgi:hypothetical protein